MSEAEVLNVVNEAFATYERETGLPRHKENTEKFDKLFEAFNKFRGAAILASVMLGIPSVCLAIIVLVKTLRGH